MLGLVMNDGYMRGAELSKRTGQRIKYKHTAIRTSSRNGGERQALEQVVFSVNA